jgi:hypothetical protein
MWSFVVQNSMLGGYKAESTGWGQLGVMDTALPDSGQHIGHEPAPFCEDDGGLSRTCLSACIVLLLVMYEQTQKTLKNFIWAHFLLRKKPGFAGVPSRAGTAPRPSNPLRASTHPKGVDIIPIIDNVGANFELINFG